MSKTIMIKDETYSRLKHLKSIRKMSFTTLLDELMEKKNDRSRYEALLRLRGSLKDIPEEKIISRDLKEGWKRWGKRYA